MLQSNQQTGVWYWLDYWFPNNIEGYLSGDIKHPQPLSYVELRRKEIRQWRDYKLFRIRLRRRFETSVSFG